jgi:hypothetical protein
MKEAAAHPNRILAVLVMGILLSLLSNQGGADTLILYHSRGIAGNPVGLYNFDTDTNELAFRAPVSGEIDTRDLAESMTLTVGDIPATGAWMYQKQHPLAFRLGGWGQQFGIGSTTPVIWETGIGTIDHTSFDPLPPASIPRPLAYCALVPL